MHRFSELIDRCSIFTLESLNQTNDRTIEALKVSGATELVKTVQMIRLQKTILAVGMFSLFEAILQNSLGCSDGFAEAKKILSKGGETSTLEQFTDLELAINVLKHGRGRSYDALIARSGGTLGSIVKQPHDQFFCEGDVSEIETLIDVDDKLINKCVQIMNQVSQAIERVRPEVIL